MKIIILNKISKLSKYIILSTLFFVMNIRCVEAIITLDPIPGVPTKSINNILDDIIKWVLGFGLMIAVTFLIWGGINYVGSSGDTTKTEKAKKIIKYSLLGVLVIGFSYAAIAMLDVIFS